MKYKTIIKAVIFIPNTPFFIILCFYVVFNIINNTSFYELQIMEGKDILNKEVKNHINKIYPNKLKYLIAGCFYCYCVIELLLNTI